ncbi:MAG: M14 family zinc carboxypeptidase [Rhodoglobus sp.]
MTDRTTTAGHTRPGSPEDILRRAGLVRPQSAFPTVDELIGRFAELAIQNPALVRESRIGTSRRGDPIPAYTIGSGERSFLIVGGVHPNEPIGFLTAIHLAEQLISDEELLASSNATWHIVPCIDPDGTRLNEAWFDAPEDRNYYSRRFYRPEPDQQVEWTFPTNYKNAYFDRMMPETQALARLIDEVKPNFYASLHNGEMGGVYYYLSRPEPALHDLLAAIPASLGLPLNTGEPESPYLEHYAPAIFGTGTNADAYDYIEALGMDATQFVGGSSSSEYTAQYGTLCLVAELPYWTHPDSDDSTELTESYSSLLLRTSADMAATSAELAAILAEAEPLLSITSPFLTASRVFVPMLGAGAEMDTVRAQQPEAHRPATVAERFGCEDIVHCFRLRYGGMMLRALEAETVAGIAGPELRRLTVRMEALYSRWQAEAAAVDSTTPIPLASLVGVQYGAILAAASVIPGGHD